MNAPLRSSIALILLLSAGIGLPGSQTVASEPAGSTIGRRTGGAVIELEQLPDYLGAGLEELRVYRWHTGLEQWSYAPYQIDERIERGRRYVTREDFQIDEDDELVTLARHLGGRAPAHQWPDGADDVEVRYDLRVTDPLDEQAEGWLHVFRSTKSEQPVPEMVAYSDVTGELTATDYRLVQARTFPGLETLELFGSDVDILDRTKLRGSVYVEVAPKLGPIPLPTQIFQADYTEESEEVVQAAKEFTFRPTKQGPVRLVLEPDGSGFAYPGQVQVFAAFGRIDLPEIPEEYEQFLKFVKRLDILFRVSVDFSVDALEGRYADGNVPEGVPIDGRPESIPERPISNWRQIDTPYGGVVMIVGRPAALRALRTYYNDSGRDPRPGTGDNKAYGDTGVFTEDLDAVDKVTDFLGWLVVVPPDSPVVGPRIEKEVRNPLQVEAIRVEREYLATATPTATDTPGPTASATASPTATSPPPSVTPAATATRPPPVVYLPLLQRLVCVSVQRPVDVVLLLDTSSSMESPTSVGGPTKLAAAREAAEVFVSLLDLTRSRAAIVTFDSRAQDLSGGFVADRDALGSALERLTTSAGTRIDLGLRAAAQLLDQRTDTSRDSVLVLLSDGAGDDRALAEAGALGRAGVRIFCIGLGEDADMDLLRQIATGPGDCFHSPGASDLADIFARIGRVIECP